jgi:antitoxin component YwqK of YwqJK toxin-antitoxin module
VIWQRRLPVSTRKKTLLALVSAVLLAALFWPRPRNELPPSLREIPAGELTQSEGRSYWKGETVPFSGIITETYPDGARKSRSVLSNGVMHGISEGWHANGVLQVREYFRAGLSQDLREKWFPSGAKMSEATVQAGRLEGTFKRWHENGQLAEEITMKNGQPDGISISYHPDGSLKAKATLENGKVIRQEFWKPGELQGPLAAASNQSQHGL